MYYSAGTYEAFAHPEKPEGVDNKSAYIIGTGLAGLTAAFYLVRDGQMKGERIHLLEKLELAGGSCDGYRDITKGFYMRGGREMDNHFEVMWDLLRSIPFLILMIMVFPLSRLLIGTAVGTTATIVPLVAAAFPFVARLVESSLREVDGNIIEAAQSMGATPMQIICKVMIPESVPSLLQNFTIALTTILGLSLIHI